MDESLKRAFAMRATAWTAFRAILEKAEHEGRALTGEERASLDKAEKDIADATGDIDRLTRAKALAGEHLEPVTALEIPVGPQRTNVEPGKSTRTKTVYGPEMGIRAFTADEEIRYADAFDRMVMRGRSNISQEDRTLLGERRAQGEGTGSAGGYLVPPGYLRQITEVMKAYGGLLGVSNVITTSTGQTLQWPNNDDTANVGTILGENTALTEVDVSFGTRTLNAWTYSSNLVLASLQVIQDSAFDVEAFVTRKLGMRIGRALAGHLMNGSGTNQPLGIATGVTVGTTGPTGKAGSPQYADVINLIHSVDPAYRNGGNCRFVFSDQALAALRLLVDSQNRPLWQPSLVEGDPDRLIGYPITVDQALAAPALNAISMLFGDFVSGYIVRQVLGIQMSTLHERYAEFLQVGYFGFARFDGRPDDPNAVKGFKGAAS